MWGIKSNQKGGGENGEEEKGEESNLPIVNDWWMGLRTGIQGLTYEEYEEHVSESGSNRQNTIEVDIVVWASMPAETKLYQQLHIYKMKREI